MILYKYQGAGNDFLIIDNRSERVSLDRAEISQLCDRRYGIGADGLMLLEPGRDGYDFAMVYYNSDGSGGMMCGNGGRCIVAFADFCGLRHYDFIAADGPHHAEILRCEGKTSIVKLQMRNVDEIVRYDQAPLVGSFLDTGTRHFVVEVPDVDAVDVEHAGRVLRHHGEFAPMGVNVNFVERDGDMLRVRTYEKGVEAETYACGTGITAAAIAAWHNGEKIKKSCNKNVSQTVRALRDTLTVEFTATATGAEDVFLIGPATYVAKIVV